MFTTYRAQWPRIGAVIATLIGAVTVAARERMTKPQILSAANLMALRAAALYDAGEPCAAEANAAKYLAGEAAFHACETTVMTHGGMGYAREYHVERYFREIQIARIAPVSPQLILSHIAERVLGLPKSY